MTIITKVGASYVDHKNDDAPEGESLGTRLVESSEVDGRFGEKER